MATGEAHDDDGRASHPLLALPSVVLHSVVGGVLSASVADAARLACVCVALQEAVHAVLCTLETFTVAQLGLPEGDVASTVAALAWIARHCSRLRVLRLDARCTDDHLAVLCQADSHDGRPMLPLLEEVHAVGALLTDDAVCKLLSCPLPSLRLVDVTSCVRVSHASVVHASKHSALVLGDGRQRPPVLVARLPEWFCQKWVCLSHRYIPKLEEHQYFRDGTFRFSRQHQATGFVMTFVPARQQDARHSELTVQFYDEGDAQLLGMPPYRPCVAVQLHPADEPHIEGAPHLGCPRMRTAQRTQDLACPLYVPDTDPPASERDVVCGTWVAAPLP